MNVHFGSQIVGSTDERLGQLRAVVYDPEVAQIISLVCQSAHLGERELLIPLQSVEDADDVTVRLRVTPDEFEELQEYSTSRNVAPPPDRDHAGQDSDEGLALPTEAPPVGAATGIESIAFTPIVQESVYIPTGDEVIDASTEVWATDGEVGHLRALLIDDVTGLLQGVVVREGSIFTHEIAVPGEWVASIRAGAVSLSVSRSDVEARRDD